MLIEALGYYATIFIKNDLDEPFDPSSYLSQIYDKLLAYIQDDSTAFATQKIHMILALMKAMALSGIDLDASTTNAGYNFINSVEEQLTETNVEDITSIVLSGTEALERCNKHGKNFVQFFSTIQTAIGYYNENPEFLDCILYAMDTAGHLGDLVQDDVFTKEYATNQFSGQDYFDYARISAPLTAAYIFYKDNIGSIPADNVPAFKIVVEGIIRGSIYGDVLPNHFIERFTKSETGGLDGIKELPKSIAKGYAYASAGFACMFANLYGLAQNYESGIYTKFSDIDCYNIFNGWINVLENCRYDYVIDFVGQAIGLCWQNTFVWTAHPYCEIGELDKAYIDGKDFALKWQERIANIIPCLSENNFSTVKNTIFATLKSSRTSRYFLSNYQSDLFRGYIKHNQELKDNRYASLFNLIFAASSENQFTKRCQIYTDNFINEINKQNNSENYMDNLDELQLITERLMQEV